MTDTDIKLKTAVGVIWEGCGQVAPIGTDLNRAAAILEQALAAGRKIPRNPDKTFQPLYGPRRDIE